MKMGERAGDVQYATMTLRLLVAVSQRRMMMLSELWNCVKHGDKSLQRNGREFSNTRIPKLRREKRKKLSTWGEGLKYPSWHVPRSRQDAWRRMRSAG
jgi:hypothetical protein